MKKIIFVFAIVALLSSCTKNKCWIMTDCLGNDIGNFCGSENEVKRQCEMSGTPACACSYRRD